MPERDQATIFLYLTYQTTNNKPRSTAGEGVLEDGTNSKSIISIVSIEFTFIFIEFEVPRIITIVL